MLVIKSLSRYTEGSGWSAPIPFGTTADRITITSITLNNFVCTDLQSFFAAVASIMGSN